MDQKVYYVLVDYFLLSMTLPSEKLGVNAVTVQHGVQGMMYLLTECSKLLVCTCSFQFGDTLYVHVYSLQLIQPQNSVNFKYTIYTLLSLFQ